MTPRPRLLFSGYYGLGNAGDEAVLSGLLRGLREAKVEADITVLSARPDLTERWHGVKAVTRMKPAALKAIQSCDLLVSGGGSLLQDVTSTASLGYYLAIIATALGVGKRVAIAAQGMGPFHRAASRRWVGGLLNRCDLLSVRDEASADLLRECGVRRKIHVTADPAFLLSSSSDQLTREHISFTSPNPSLSRRGISAVGEEESPCIGLALRSWSDRDATGWGAELCRELSERGCLPYMLPMQEPQDRELATAIQERAGVPVTIAPPPETMDDVMAAISHCNALIGMRLHALLLAANDGIPLVAWSYDPKVDALMKRIGGQQAQLPLSASPRDAADATLSVLASPAMPGHIRELRGDAIRTAFLLRELLNPSG